MNKIRITVGEVFQSPLQNLSFVQYMANVNTAGKVTAKSLMDLVTVLFTYAEEQEKKNEQYEANFREVESILVKLVEQKVNTIETVPMPKAVEIAADVKEKLEAAGTFVCTTCGKQLSTKLALSGHSRSHLPKKE